MIRLFFRLGDDDGEGVGRNTAVAAEAAVVEIPRRGEEVLLRVVNGTAVVGVGRRASSMLGIIRSSSSVEVATSPRIGAPPLVLARDDDDDTGIRLSGLCVVLGAVALVVVRGVVDDVLGFRLVLATVVRLLSSDRDLGFT